MKPEIENALKNIDVVCSNIRLSRNEHAELARNIMLIRNALVAAEINAKSAKAKPKKETKNGK